MKLKEQRILRRASDKGLYTTDGDDNRESAGVRKRKREREREREREKERKREREKERREKREREKERKREREIDEESKTVRKDNSAWSMLLPTSAWRYQTFNFTFFFSFLP